MNTRLSAVSFYTLKQIEFQSFNRKTAITHYNFRHCRVKVYLVCKTTFLETAVYTWVERGTVNVKCLAQEHHTMTPARTRAQTVPSGVERTNHETSAPPCGRSDYL